MSVLTFREIALWIGLLVWAADLQSQTTQVDLRMQAKNIDFSTANSTRPMKVGTLLPATCILGEAFFKADAPAGQNLYGCTATNTWVLQTRGDNLFADMVPFGGVWDLSSVSSLKGKSGAADPATCVAGQLFFNTTFAVQKVCSSANTWTAIRSAAAGPGITVLHSGSTATISPDTAVMLSRATHQAGTDLTCSSSGGSGTTYTCSVMPALTAYTAGQKFVFVPDVACSTDPTLNINALGAVNLQKLTAGSLTNLAADDCRANVPYVITKAAGAFVLSKYDHQSDLTSVTGTLDVANGGTGQSSFMKGDLLIAAGPATFVKLPVGDNDKVLTADSSRISGVKWADGGAGSSFIDYQKKASAVAMDGTDKVLFETVIPGGSIRAGGCIEVHFAFQRTSGSEDVLSKLKYGSGTFTVHPFTGGGYVYNASGFICNDPGTTGAQQVSIPSMFASQWGAGGGVLNPTQGQVLNSWAVDSTTVQTLSFTASATTGTEVTPLYWIVKGL